MISTWRVLIVSVIMISACSKTGRGTTEPLPNPTSPINSSNGKKYLALGDSYTIGQSVPVTDRFPVQTKVILDKEGVNMADPQIIAATGWTTANLQAAIANQNPVGPYDVVTLLIGVNDQYQRMDTAGYRVRFTQLLQKSISLVNNKPEKVIVISIPDYSVTPFASNSDTARIRKEIDQFNFINKEVSTTYKSQYLDITPSSREAKTNTALLAPDGLHPSGLEYKKWAERLAVLVKAIL